MTAPETAVAASSSNVRVVARIRPLSCSEKERGSKESITSLGDGCVSSPNGPECLQVLDSGGEKRFFELDGVFDAHCSQQAIYERCGAKTRITQDIFKGFNCTILAYGQTGAGKTFTMGTAAASGKDNTLSEMDGMIPRACLDLFETIAEKCDGNAQVEMSYLEIYNEEIRDLMATVEQGGKPKKLTIRENLNGEVYVQGSEYKKVASPQDIGALMEEAAGRRVVASTAMNAVSSRSHAICTLRIQGVLENDDKFESKLTLVDLAGSERIKKTGAQGNRRQEGININKGLFVLGQVVSALSDQARNPTRARKPPYRDSKLTRMLQDSLGGNSRTIMVACCSPADYNTEESMNTLRYATSARNIKNTATRNLVQQLSPQEAAKLQRENELLKKQVAELQATLRAVTEGAASTSTAAVTGGDVQSVASADTARTESTTRCSLSTVSSMSSLKDATTASDTSCDDGGDETNSNSKQRIQELEALVRDLQNQAKAFQGEAQKLAAGSAVELPALHVEVELLKEQLKELMDTEMENVELRQDLAEALASGEAARAAAAQLSDIMDRLKQLQGNELKSRRVEYKYKKKEEEWVGFVLKMLQHHGEQLVHLENDFELVQRLVENPIVLKKIGDKFYATKPIMGYQQQKKKRWFDFSLVNKGEVETVEVEDPDMWHMALLKEHIKFFQEKMKEVESVVQKEAEDLTDMKDMLHSAQEALLHDIGSEELLLENINKEDNILDQLTAMLLRPMSVLASLDQGVLGSSGNGESNSGSKGSSVPEYIEMSVASGGPENSSVPGSVESKESAKTGDEVHNDDEDEEECGQDTSR